MCKNTYINPHKIFLSFFCRRLAYILINSVLISFLIQWVSESTSKLVPILCTQMNIQLQQIYSEIAV